MGSSQMAMSGGAHRLDGESGHAGEPTQIAQEWTPGVDKRMRIL